MDQDHELDNHYFGRGLAGLDKIVCASPDMSPGAVGHRQDFHGIPRRKQQGTGCRGGLLSVLFYLFSPRVAFNQGQQLFLCRSLQGRYLFGGGIYLRMASTAVVIQY